MTSRIQREYPIEILFDWKPERVVIPLDWTPEQADKIVTILGRIDERIWTLYSDDLVNLARYENLLENHLEADLKASANIEDDIPF